jgi:hypothetical protein
MKAINRAVCALLFSLSVVGCGNKGSGSGDTGGAPVAAKGIDAAGNDPAVVALAKKAAGCKWTDYGFDYDCADKKAWEQSELLKEGKADATLVSMLEDSNEGVRWLAVNGLSNNGSKYQTDKALAERVMAVAEGEKAKSVARSVGSVAGRIKMKGVGLVDRGKALFKSPTPKDTRLGFIGSAQFANSDDFYELTKELAKSDPDTEIRDAAMSAYWTGTPSAKNAEVCALWLELSHDEKNEEFAAHAAYFAAFYPHNSGCKAEWDTMLGDIEKRAKAGTAKSSYWGSALYYLHGQSAASAAQKKRAIAIAKTMAGNKSNSANARVRALELVGEKDPGGKAFVNKFVNDPDSYVKSRAAELVKKAK